MLKCPYYGLWKVHILVLGVPNNRLTCTQSHKYFHCHNMHLFFTLLSQRLPTDSFNGSFSQTPPFRDANLLWLVSFHHACNAWKSSVCERSATLCTAKPLFLPLQKCHLAAKNYLHFYSDQWEKTNKWAGNMLMFHVDINMKRLGIRFKNNLFQWFRVDSFFWEKIALYMCTFRCNTLQNVFIHLELCYTLYER